MLPDKISNSAMDWKEHKSTYKGVVAMFKYSTIGLVVLLALMAAFLV